MIFFHDPAQSAVSQQKFGKEQGSMKCFTLNSHSLAEPAYEEKLEQFIEGIAAEEPDIMALQESSQSICAEEISEHELTASGFFPCPLVSVGEKAVAETVKIRRDNHAFQIAVSLRSRGLPYYWTWTGAKIGYGKYDEGMAMFSRYPVLSASQFYLTASHDYQNWKTRKALSLSIRTEKEVASFACVHMGWWKEEDPFSAQWERLLTHLRPLLEKGHVWLIGDFNSPSQAKGEGYDLIRNSGWRDTYLMAEKKDSGVTVPGQIDGWRNQGEISGMRIDYVWLSPRSEQEQPIRICSSNVLFNGKTLPVVSDHYGVLTEWKYE